MSVLVALAALAGVIAAAVVLRLAWRGTAAARRAIRTKTTRVADLGRGRVELAGVIRVVGEPLVAPSGKASVAARVWFSARATANRKSKHVVLDRTVVRAVERAMLRDDSGEVELELDRYVKIVAAEYTTEDWRTTVPAKAAAWFEDAPKTGKFLNVFESRIDDGARVLVHGRAEPVDAEIERGDEGGYRGAAPIVTQRYRVKVDMIAAGGQNALLFRSAWPVLLLVGVAAALFYHAAILAALAYW